VRSNTAPVASSASTPRPARAAARALVLVSWLGPCSSAGEQLENARDELQLLGLGACSRRSWASRPAASQEGKRRPCLSSQARSCAMCLDPSKSSALGCFCSSNMAGSAVSVVVLVLPLLSRVSLIKPPPTKDTGGASRLRFLGHLRISCCGRPLSVLGR
jgi:hypothetical protein